ncbi:MAG: flagellar filament capping protein FliD [Clostridiales bacterium]|nr:flagellar filament capping protein FliD [Clostridiales bacterium]
MSSVQSSAYGSNARITGLFSGLDTDALVQGMCSNQQSKIDKQVQKKTTFEWQSEAVQEVLDAVKEFSNTYCSPLGASSMLKASTYSAYAVTSVGTSGAVTLSASGSSVVDGSYAVRVLQLARNAGVSSAGKVSSEGGGLSPSNTTALADLAFQTPLQFDSAGKLSFSINGKLFSFSRDTSLQNMLNTINTDPDAQVTMKYSRLSDSFSIAANAGGRDSVVSIVNLTGNAFGAGGAFQIDTGVTRNGRNSLAEINGTLVERDSNTYTEDGLTFGLHAVTAAAEDTQPEEGASASDAGGGVHFSVSRDYSSTADAAGAFVEALNTLLSKLDGLVSAKDYAADYPPLTEAQRKEMSQEQIEAWEEKAKTGLLRHHPDLQRLLSGLRGAFFSAAGGTGKSMTAIGFSSGGYFTSDKGRLFLDTDALTAALRENPQEVVQMFTGGTSTAASGEQGLLYKIRSALSAYQSAAGDSVSNAGDKIAGIDSDIGQLEDRLDALAEKYYARFSAMEAALAALNSQAVYISQLFAQ